MPRGLNRSGNFSKGTPIDSTHQFGNVITFEQDFGNDITGSPILGNEVIRATNNFGNLVSPSLGGDGNLSPTPPAGSYDTNGAGLLILFALVNNDVTAADVVYYTIDGTTPTTSSARACQIAPGIFEGPVILGSNIVIKAFAVLGSQASNVSDFAFYDVT